MHVTDTTYLPSWTLFQVLCKEAGDFSMICRPSCLSRHFIPFSVSPRSLRLSEEFRTVLQPHTHQLELVESSSVLRMVCF